MIAKIDLWKILALFNNSKIKSKVQNPTIVWLQVQRKSKGK